jgi:hypothetical protein
VSKLKNQTNKTKNKKKNNYNLHKIVCRF